MKVYSVTFGFGASSVDDRWFVRARSFEEASRKASKTARAKEEGYTHGGRDVVSITLLGNEE